MRSTPGRLHSRLGTSVPTRSRRLTTLTHQLPNRRCRQHRSDYQGRRQVIGPNLLPDRIWRALCRDKDLEGGVGGAKLRAARCYLYTTLTGTSLYQAPIPLSLPSNALRMHYESFVFHMNDRLAGALADYAHGYLTDLGISDEHVS
ncbi:hypothetical protein [Rhodococcus sp. NCIMB 12038]|uniref:hypothetical protein n=1 Tax=Rhodococcus sp. NCIMB 12038 TaxID=933800 RepID=UPI00117B5A3D|nr:hypothetical protein [Rhodococcus sp. NCIMB 12038]